MQVSTWSQGFDFTAMTQASLRVARRDFHMMEFPKTTVMSKTLIPHPDHPEEQLVSHASFALPCPTHVSYHEANTPAQGETIRSAAASQPLLSEAALPTISDALRDEDQGRSSHAASRVAGDGVSLSSDLDVPTLPKPESLGGRQSHRQTACGSRDAFSGARGDVDAAEPSGAWTAMQADIQQLRAKLHVSGPETQDCDFCT